MKKLFNRTQRPVPEWNGFDESEYDWDEADLSDESEAYYEETEEGEYYADGDLVNEDLEDAYLTDEDLTDGDALYYAEDESAETDGAYYEDGEDPENADYYEEAYAESGDVQDGEMYDSESETPIDYAEEGEEEYYEEEAAFVGRPAGSTQTKERKRRRGLGGMSLMDQMILGTGVAVLVLALVTVGFYVGSRMIDRQISGFASVGNQLDGIDVIGEAGLLAVADAQIARLAAAGLLNGDQQEYQDNEGYNESEYLRDIVVTMEFVSIQKDLKIKFVNDATGKLIANVPFAVQVTDPNGNTFIWSDDDMDGIIYKKDIIPGTYKVVMEALADERYSRYTLSTITRTVDVRKDIAYEMVEVANEIKSEDEVDASQEDTAINDTVVESSLQDTVAWVESHEYPGAYIEVDKSSILKPTSVLAGSATARTSGVGGVVLTDEPGPEGGTEGETEGGSGEETGEGNGGGSGEGSGEGPGEGSEEGNGEGSGGGSGEGNGEGSEGENETLIEMTVQLMPSSVATVVGGTVTSQIDVTNIPDGKKPTYSFAGGGNAVAVSIDADGKITIIGKAVISSTIIFITVKCEGCKEVTKELYVTINPAKTISLEKTGVTFVGEPLVLNATVANAVTPVFRATSSNDSIATVAVKNSEITVNGLKVGTVTITVELVESNAVTGTATCTVTVMEHPKNDKVTPLTDSNNHQLFVLDNGVYRQAVYADYYVESNKFYLQTEPRYTGWQNFNGKVYYFTADGKYVTGEQVIQGAKYNFASDGTLVTGSGMLGIDVSKFNTITNWNAVRNSGVNFVIIRCGYRGSSTGGLIEDPMFRANIQGAIAAGIKVGIYFFTQAVDEREAVEEASMVLELIKNYKISYPIFLDVESSGGRADAIDNATRTAVCKAFCQTIQSRGYTAGIYANKNWLETKLDPSALSAYKIWLAQYRSTPTYTGRYNLWQYSSTGHINGITGDVDMDLSYLGY